MPAIITIHRLQEKAKTGRQLLMEEKENLLLCRTSERVHFLSCDLFIYIFIFCRGTLIGSHIRALLKHFVAPHRPAAEIACRPLKVKYQQVLSLIKASRMSRVLFYFFTLSLRWHSDETWQPTRK